MIGNITYHPESTPLVASIIGISLGICAVLWIVYLVPLKRREGQRIGGVPASDVRRIVKTAAIIFSCITVSALAVFTAVTAIMRG